MSTFNEKDHPRAPKGTENGGEFIDKEYGKITESQQKLIAQKLRKKLLDIGIYVSEPNTSITDYGVSTYLTYKDLNGEEYKFRISDHSVENTGRLLNEFHYDENTNLDDLLNKFTGRVIGSAYNKSQRDTLFKKAKIKDDYLFGKRELLLSGQFKNSTFSKYERTFMNLTEFKNKHPNATNILQIPDGNAFYYEYETPRKKGEYQERPTLKYIENINKLIK